MGNITLEGADLAYLQEFVKEVLVVCANDLEGITGGLDTIALNAGIILGIEKEDMEYIQDRG